MRFYRYLILFLLFAFVAGCTHEEDHPGGGHTGFGDTVELSITVNVPGIKPSTYALTQTDESKLERIDILVFDVEGATETFSYATHGIDITSGKFTAKVKKSAKEQRFVFFANFADSDIRSKVASFSGKTKAQVYDLITFSSPIELTGANKRTALPMWRECATKYTIGDTPVTIETINLIRSVARIDVGLKFKDKDNILNDELDGLSTDFVLKEVTVYNANTTGLGAAFNMPADGKATAPALPTTLATANKIYTVTGGKGIIREIYVSEFDNKNKTQEDKMLCLVVKGSYKSGADSWYRIDFLVKPDDVSKGRYDLLRNFCYRVNITSVGGSGYGSADEAFKSKPVNMEASIVAWNIPAIKDVATDGQYKLGVSQSEFTFTKEARDINSKDNILSVITDYPQGWKVSKITDKVDPTDPAGSDINSATNTATGWITLSPNTGASGSTATVAHLLLKENTSGNLRAGYIHLTAGRLIYTVKVTQNALNNIGILLTGADGKEISVLEFVSAKDVQPAVQTFDLHWTPKDKDVLYSVSALGNIFEFDKKSGEDDIIGSDKYNENDGKKSFKIRPPAITTTNLNSDPFYSRSSLIVYTISDGVSSVTKTLTLRQMVYNLVTNKASSYRLDGSTYTLNVKSNTGWRIKSVTPSVTQGTGQLLNLNTSDNLTAGTTGGYNTSSGTPITFRAASNLNLAGTVTVVFESTASPAHFNDVSVVLDLRGGDYIPATHKGWAGSNIYWDGTKLTFDDVSVLTNKNYQGVYFQWGSLWGISPQGAWSNNSTAIYKPKGDLTGYEQSTASSWGAIPRVLDATNITANRNRAYLYEITSGKDGIGDICKYLTDQAGGTIHGKKWRMPTSQEFEAKSDYLYYGSFGSATSNSAVGKYGMTSGVTKSGTGTPSFPAAGLRYNSDGSLGYVGSNGYYWSGSPDGSLGYSLYFGLGYVYPSNSNYRAYGFSVRCVQE